MSRTAIYPEPTSYPDSDGQPMADNTLQFRWIVTVKENLDRAEAGFVAGDLLWYPVEGEPEIRVAPDVLVVPERPKGDRGSYRQWLEDGVAPAVVFEVLSPSNTVPEMMQKLAFYERHGVDEFYILDPDVEVLEVFLRIQGALREVPWTGAFVSPRLGIRFERAGERLVVLHRDGVPFQTFAELAAERDHLSAERDQAAAERDQAAAERDQAAAERDQAAAERDRLRERLRAAGLDPDG